MSRTHTLTAIFALVMGTLLLGTWTVLFALGRVDKPAQRVELVLLLVAEAGTGLSLIVGGATTLWRRHCGAPLLLVGLGMLVYCTVYSVGVFAAAGNRLATAWFVAVAVSAAGAAVALVAELARATRATRRALPTIIVSLALALLGPGCAAELDSGHAGYRQPDCWLSGCHAPSSTHERGAPASCVQCHGRNGAPAGHASRQPCERCHAAVHGGAAREFDPGSCQSCH